MTKKDSGVMLKESIARVGSHQMVDGTFISSIFSLCIIYFQFLFPELIAQVWSHQMVLANYNI